LNLATPIPLSFETQRFLIRRYELSDEDSLYDAARASISEVFEFLPWCHPDYDRSDATGWLETVEANWKEGSGFSFGIFGKDDGEFHGGCGINRTDEHPVGNLGYWIKTASTGKGIAKEATISLADFGFQKIGLKRIEIIMSVKNAASQGVAVGAGAQFEGTMKNRLMLHGNTHDAHLYAITPDD
jgi:RimJ/RimL family protein N-acetyltransferase